MYLVYIIYSICFFNELLLLLYVCGVVLFLLFFSLRLVWSDIDLRLIYVYCLVERGCF